MDAVPVTEGVRRPVQKSGSLVVPVDDWMNDSKCIFSIQRPHGNPRVRILRKRIEPARANFAIQSRLDDQMRSAARLFTRVPARKIA
jgi:hypothetical protein